MNSFSEFFELAVALKCGTCTLVWVSATYNNVVPLQAVLNKEESHIGSKDVACLQHTIISKTRTRRDR